MALTNITERDTQFLLLNTNKDVGPGSYENSKQLLNLKKRTSSNNPPPFMSGSGSVHGPTLKNNQLNRSAFNSYIEPKYTPGPG